MQETDRQLERENIISLDSIALVSGLEDKASNPLTNFLLLSLDDQ